MTEFGRFDTQMRSAPEMRRECIRSRDTKYKQFVQRQCFIITELRDAYAYRSAGLRNDQYVRCLLSSSRSLTDRCATMQQHSPHRVRQLQIPSECSALAAPGGTTENAGVSRMDSQPENKLRQR